MKVKCDRSFINVDQDAMSVYPNAIAIFVETVFSYKCDRFLVWVVECDRSYLMVNKRAMFFRTCAIAYLESQVRSLFGMGCRVRSPMYEG